MKEPFVTRIESITEDNEPYSDAQLFDYFPPANDEADKSIDSKNLEGEHFTWRELEELLTYLDPGDRPTWIAVGHAIKTIDEESRFIYRLFSRKILGGNAEKFRQPKRCA